MESEDVGHVPAVELPEPISQWLDETADELGCSRQRLRSELFTTHRTLHEEDVSDERLDELHDEFMEKLTDVRERVVQIKRETDGKAPADHEHDDLRNELDGFRTELFELRKAVNAEDGSDVAIDELVDELDALSERVADNRERLDSGFENYEEVLEYLTDTTDELDERLDVLARALVSIRDQTRTLAARSATQAATAELARTANRHGVTSAKCGDCEGSVTIALLTEPSCPHCGATFEDVEPKEGFFGANWLVVGRPPALEGDVFGGDDFDADTDIDSDVEEFLTEVTEE
ncbi:MULTISPECIES: hypothetical protein [unclassified Haladaptatus]|uniref:hypothetical protein n=1 Tax=unclassified Haladaptatus TaxID=2622732 RepID=UPI00209C5C03|nr:MULTISPECIES: hypothetical protein [unclassified Haladaptatus]MCO8243341.1 hypothetical protein [Haladaptatus sp. AB643]MCO8253052.1 hypothetical protein [Haladaptatus sp. AB618]